MNYKKLIFLFAGLFFSLSIFAQTYDADAVDGKIYFKLKNNISSIYKSNGLHVDLNKVDILSNLISKYNITSISRPFYTADDKKLERTYSVKFDNYSMINLLIKDLENESIVEYAEKAPLFHLSFIPNDAEYTSSINKRWYLNRINAEQAWDLDSGDVNIKVAIVDNGIWTNHPDLVNKVVAQADLADNDNDATPGAQTNEWSHGTHVSGTVAAETNNGIGIAAIGYNVSILAAKCAPNTSSGNSVSAGYEGIVWATDNGADVINMSWGGTSYFQTGQNTVNYAYNKGVVLVAAAGNDNVSTLHYPSAYNHVISVASTDNDDGKSYFSNYGTSIDVCSPGGFYSSSSIYSCTYTNAPNATYGYMAGTSMASPICAGLCGLMLSADTNLTPEKLEIILKATCDDISAQNSGYNGQLGDGRINAFAAITAVIDSLNNGTGSNGIIADFSVSSTMISDSNDVVFTDLSTGSITGWSWSFQGGTPAVSNSQNPTITYNTPGTYQVTLTVTDGTNSNTEIKTNIITVNSSFSSAWIPQASGFANPSRGIGHISIVDANTVWGTAYDGVTTSNNIQEFTRTNNGGTTWTPGTIDLGDSNLGIAMVHAFSYDVAWVVGYPLPGSGDGGIWKTTNGGTNWTKQTTALFNTSSSFSNVVYFWDADTGFCQGDPDSYFELYTTNNGGANWTRVPQANIPAFINGEYGYTGQYETYGNSIWFTTNKGRIYHSTDKGHNFNVYNSPISDFGGDPINGTLTFKDDTTGVIIDYNGVVYGTNDAGATWTTLNNNSSGNIFGGNACYIQNTDMIISVGAASNASGSSYSNDGGLSWDTLDHVQHLYVEFLDMQTGWSGWFNTTSTDAGMWKWIGVPVVNVGSIVSEKNLVVYPNPNNGNFNISISGVNDNVNIEIYNLMGKVVHKTSENNISGKHSVNIDLSNLAKGVYIAVIKSGNTVNTEKIIIR